jgi:hypothetical protein
MLSRWLLLRSYTSRYVLFQFKSHWLDISIRSLTIKCFERKPRLCSRRPKPCWYDSRYVRFIGLKWRAASPVLHLHVLHSSQPAKGSFRSLAFLPNWLEGVGCWSRVFIPCLETETDNMEPGAYFFIYPVTFAHLESQKSLLSLTIHSN